MLTPDRHRIILELLESRGVVKLQEFVEATSSSESTIRRDLSQLENENKLKRVHGGASILHQKGEELDLIEKTTHHPEEKEKIARYAASLIEDGDCIYIDAGTTTLKMIPYIRAKHIKVVTNGLPHLDALVEKGIETYVTGGYVKQKTKALIGRGAVAGLASYSFDKSFIGVNGVHEKFGFTTPDPEEAEIKQLAIKGSQQAYVLTDSSKFQQVTFSKIADMKDAVIITDLIDEELLAIFSVKTTIKVVKP